MKKIIGIALVLAVMVTMCFSTVALAWPGKAAEWDWSGAGDFEGEVSSTTVQVWVDMTWEGEGSLSATAFGLDGRTAGFNTGGDYIEGSFDAYMNTKVPVDLFDYSIDTTIANGGIYQWLEGGGAGSYNWLDVYGSSGTMVASGEYTHFTKPKVNTDYWHDSNSNFTVTEADFYYIEHYIEYGDDGAGVWAEGEGDATLDCQGSRMWLDQRDPITFGPTTATFDAGSSGIFGVWAEGHNGVTFNDFDGLTSTGNPTSVYAYADAGFDWNNFPTALTANGNGNSGDASLNVIIGFASSFDVDDFSAEVE